MNKIRNFFSVYADELLHKVQWPKQDDLQNNTITVLIASLMIAFVIALMDYVFKTGLTLFYSLFE